MKVKPIKPATEIDWARLAAFIDGEGCIYISTGGPRQTSLFVTVVNTDPRLVEWISQTFGGCVFLQKKTSDKWARCWKWAVSSKHATEILEGCMPYFVIKADQAQIGLAHNRLVGHAGPKGHPREVHEERFRLRDQLSMLKGTNSRRKDLRGTEVVQ